MSDSNKLTIAQAYQRLESLTKEFENNQLDLEAFVPKYEEAVKLAKFLKTELRKIETQIEEINLELEDKQPEFVSPEDEPPSDDIPF